jgi:hypothetical protein
MLDPRQAAEKLIRNWDEGGNVAEEVDALREALAETSELAIYPPRGSEDDRFIVGLAIGVKADETIDLDGDNEPAEGAARRALATTRGARRDDDPQWIVFDRETEGLTILQQAEFEVQA